MTDHEILLLKRLSERIDSLTDVVTTLAQLIEIAVPRPLTTPANHPREDDHGSR